MKRRDLIKTSLLTAGAAIGGGVIGAQIKHQNIPDDKFELIQPKQTQIYSVITPLPLRHDLIDEMIKFNSSLKKCKIKTVYNNIPYPLAQSFGAIFQGYKGENPSIQTFKDFAQYVKHAQDAGFEFVYLLNSPRPILPEEFEKNKKEFFYLLENLRKTGCKTIKVANSQLLSILEKADTGFNYSLSTSFEYHNVSQYENIINEYPKIVSMNIAIDDNKNFKFLSALKKKFPKTDIEIMVNERCMHGCPARILHPSTFFGLYDCDYFYKKWGAIKQLCKSNVIYPWQLDYYSAIGINTFKFMSYSVRADISNINYLKNYLSYFENGVDKLSAIDLFNSIFELNVSGTKYKDLKLKDIISYLPDMRHFLQHGDKCATECSVNCFYCEECAKKLEKILQA